MKHLLSIARYVPKRAAFFSVLGFALLVPAVGAFAWGPGRDTYTMNHAATHPVFNSITDNPVQGDERQFMQIRESDKANSTYADSISLKPDTEYTVFIYYHNDANKALNASGKGIAHGTYVKADLPNYINDGQTKVNANGYVGASNASQVFDEVYLSNATGSKLTLSYVKGSAVIHNNNQTNGMTLSDSIVTSGAKIGDEKLDGNLHACSDYSGYVTFTMKTSAKTAAPAPAPTAPSTFTVQKDVRVKGSTTWADTATAKPGDTVQYLISYANTGSTTQTAVMVKDALPAGVTYVSGTSSLKNSSNPNGKYVSDSIIGNGINIGTYDGGANGFVTFEAKIDDSSVCGSTTLTNSATVSTGNQTKSDTAALTVTKDCTTAQPTQPAQPTQTVPATTTPVAVTPTQQPTGVQPQPTAQPTAQAAVTTTTTQTTQTTTPAPTVTTTAPAAAAPASTPAATPAATPAPTTTPSTGPTEIASGLLGMSSLGLGTHHYLQSRRVLRKARQ